MNLPVETVAIQELCDHAQESLLSKKAEQEISKLCHGSRSKDSASRLILKRLKKGLRSGRLESSSFVKIELWIEKSRKIHLFLQRIRVRLFLNYFVLSFMCSLAKSILFAHGYPMFSSDFAGFFFEGFALLGALLWFFFGLVWIRHSA